MNELYYLLELNGICIETDDQERDRAIRLLLELKRKKAYKINKKEITDQDIINEYNINGMNGIKNFFERENHKGYPFNKLSDEQLGKQFV